MKSSEKRRINSFITCRTKTTQCKTEGDDLLKMAADLWTSALLLMPCVCSRPLSPLVLQYHSQCELLTNTIKPELISTDVQLGHKTCCYLIVQKKPMKNIVQNCLMLSLVNIVAHQTVNELLSERINQSNIQRSWILKKNYKINILKKVSVLAGRDTCKEIQLFYLHYPIMKSKHQMVFKALITIILTTNQFGPQSNRLILQRTKHPGRTFTDLQMFSCSTCSHIWILSLTHFLHDERKQLIYSNIDFQILQDRSFRIQINNEKKSSKNIFDVQQKVNDDHYIQEDMWNYTNVFVPQSRDHTRLFSLGFVFQRSR